MEIKASENRRIAFDILRIFSTFLVIILHISGQYWYSFDIKTYEWNVFNIYDGLCRWCVPAFVMMSGALFLGHDHSMEKLYKKNILRMFSAFVVWEVIYAVLTYHETHLIRKALICFFTGYYHMWFVLMIAGLYMIVPLLRKIVTDRSMMKYFLILGFVFSVLIAQFTDIVGIFSLRYNIHLHELFDKFYFRFAAGYSFYFVLGYFIDTMEWTKKRIRIVYALGILGFISTVGCTVIVAFSTGFLNELFYRYFTVNVMLEAVFMFVLFKNAFSKISLSEKTTKAVLRASKYSFGVYLAHAMIITLLNEWGFSAISFNPAIAIPTVSLVVMAISYVISAILNHIPFLNKYVV